MKRALLIALPLALVACGGPGDSDNPDEPVADTASADERVAYANELSPTGKAFFNNQLRQLIPNFTDIE